MSASARIIPPVPAWADYTALWPLEDVWRPALNAICAETGLDPARFARRTQGGGTHIVWLDPPRTAIKLHCPFFRDAPAEQSVLGFMTGRLRVETPRLLGTGDIEGWPYTVTSFVRGEPMTTVLSGLDRASRLDVAFQFGSMVREWHDASLSGDVAAPRDWRKFIGDREAACMKLRAGSGLDAELLRQVPAFLDGFAQGVSDPRPLVLLHTDFEREHVRMSRSGGRWAISGLIDFGDSMYGHREYDLIKATHALAPSDRDVLRAFFQGYGECGITMSREGSEQMLRWALLHFDTPVARYVRDGVGESNARTLPELAAEVWPLA